MDVRRIFLRKIKATSLYQAYGKGILLGGTSVDGVEAGPRAALEKCHKPFILTPK